MIYIASFRQGIRKYLNAIRNLGSKNKSNIFIILCSIYYPSLYNWGIMAYIAILKFSSLLKIDYWVHPQSFWFNFGWNLRTCILKNFCWTMLWDPLCYITFMHWRRKWQPTPVFLPGESQGRGSLVGCRLWGRTESDTTEVT